MNCSSISRIRDNGGRRHGIDLRQFSYTDHIPERRSGGDRRSGFDRRSGLDRRSGKDRRCGIDIRKEREGGAEVIDMRSYADRRSGTERRSAFR